MSTKVIVVSENAPNARKKSAHQNTGKMWLKTMSANHNARPARLIQNSCHHWIAQAKRKAKAKDHKDNDYTRQPVLSHSFHEFPLTNAWVVINSATFCINSKEHASLHLEVGFRYFGLSKPGQYLIAPVFWSLAQVSLVGSVAILYLRAIGY